MNQFNMIKASIDSIETLGLVDGPGIRTIIFFNGCKLRCKYCHNPEMWKLKEKKYTPSDIYKKVIRSKNYFGKNGGVTFSGGEPLLHDKFIIETAKILKNENIHIAIDTAGVGHGNYNEILKYIDLVILDIKHTDPKTYKDITGLEMKEINNFIKAVNEANKKVWIRQVIIPNITDSEEYINELIKYLKQIKNIEKIEFLPFHRLGREKYLKLNIPYPYENKNDMNKDKCNELYKLFEKKYKSTKTN